MIDQRGECPASDIVMVKMSESKVKGAMEWSRQATERTPRLKS